MIEGSATHCAWDGSATDGKKSKPCSSIRSVQGGPPRTAFVHSNCAHFTTFHSLSGCQLPRRSCTWKCGRKLISSVESERVWCALIGHIGAIPRYCASTVPKETRSSVAGILSNAPSQTTLAAVSLLTHERHHSTSLRLLYTTLWLCHYVYRKTVPTVCPHRL